MPPEQTITERPSVAIVCWDLTHNAVGRAIILADMLKDNCEVELVGPLFGLPQRIWPPIKDFDIPIKTFAAPSFKEFVLGAAGLASTRRYDYVYVSKARFPSVFLGMLIKMHSQCPLVVDLDEFEPSFFAPDNNDISNFGVFDEESSDRWETPTNKIWTLFAQQLLASADGLTVSNPALQARFGGTLVRHARNELTFDPTQYNRLSVRAQFGYSEKDKVVLFFGTARKHKGLLTVARALEQIADPLAALCVVGECDKAELEALKQIQSVRIDVHGYQPWERIPELLTVADLVCILQDPVSPISQFQTPAKLTDALAMDVLTLVYDVPPLRDIVETNCVSVTTEETLAKDIQHCLGAITSEATQSKRRELFLTEFSYGVNRARIEAALRIAKMKELPKEFFRVIELIERQFGVEIL